MASQFTRKLLIASKVKGVGRVGLRQLAADQLFFRTPLEDLAEQFEALAQLSPSGPLLKAAVAAVEQELEASERNSDHIISVADPHFPSNLKICDDSPVLLYVRGNLACLNEKAVAVVGTREPTEAGVAMTARIASYFASKSWTVVSGLALGVDSIAHKATVDTKGATVAVLAHGLNFLAPKSNQRLADQILETGGALVTEYPYKTAPFSSNFVERDRIQAGLSRAVIVTQTDLSGGSLHACRASMRYGRFVLAPAPIERDILGAEPKIRGIQKLLYGTPEEKTQLLKCPVALSSRILEIASRDDYPAIEAMLEQHSS